MVLFGTNLYHAWFQFSIVDEDRDAVTASSRGAIWGGFNEQHQPQSIKKKHHIYCPIRTFLVQIKCIFS
jgi:hypothetical protein